MTIFDLDKLTVSVHTDAGLLQLTDAVSLAVEQREVLCIVGESGSGKSVTVLSAVRLLEFTAPLTLRGAVNFDGRDLLKLSQPQLATIRGRRIGMIFQEALEALNPTRTVASQLAEAYALSRGLRRIGADARQASETGQRLASRLLEEVDLDPGVLRLYPHQLSGGMQQRVMIAMALMGEPDLLIADEPTTALDVTVQAGILRLLRRLQQERHLACILVTHDMGVASQIADRIAVLYAGQVLEVGTTEQMLTSPQHPYTKALLECVPRPNQRLLGRMRSIPGQIPEPGNYPPGDRFAPRNALADERDLTEPPPTTVSEDGSRMVRSWAPVLEWTPEMVDRLTGHLTVEAEGTRLSRIDRAKPVVVLESVSKTYGNRAVRRTLRRAGAPTEGVDIESSGTRRALRDVSLTIHSGELFGLVGETGSGKTTLGKLIVDLEQADDGSVVRVAGTDLSQRRGFREERDFRRTVQMVFQNPTDSFDPRRTVGAAIAEPLEALTELGKAELRSRVKEMLEAVGLPDAFASRYPSQLSGGQRQRVAIARALAPNPQLVVADEPTSALDVSMQGQVMNLLLDLQRDLGLTYVFITHNLSLVTAVADRIGVMYRGELVEVATAEALVSQPEHDYTKALLASNPNPFAKGWQRRP